MRPASILASIYRATWGKNKFVVAVSGSFGKTTTTRAVSAALGLVEHRWQTVGFNSFAAVYFQLLRQMGLSRFAVVEIGIGYTGQMKRYAQVVRPQVAVITTVGSEHLKYFVDGLEGIRHEKAELVRALPPESTAVLNRDDPNVMWMATQTQARIVTYGFDAEADVVATHVEPDGVLGTRISLRVGQKTYTLQTGLLGRISIYPMLAAVAAAMAVGLDVNDAVESLQNFKATPRRLEPTRLVGGAVVLLDDCKGTPETIHAAFDVLESLPAARRLAIWGHITPHATVEPLETLYYQIGEHAARVMDRVYLIHLTDIMFDASRQGLLKGGMAPQNILRVQNVQEAANALREDLQTNDVVLLKGRPLDRLSRIVFLLQDKTVRCRVTQCPRNMPYTCDACSLLTRDFNPPRQYDDWENLIESSNPTPASHS